MTARANWQAATVTDICEMRNGQGFGSALLGPTRMLEAPTDDEERWKNLGAVAACVATNKEKTDVA